MAKFAPWLLLALSLLVALSSSAYLLKGDVIDGGGTRMVSSGYVLRGSIAQPTIGKIQSSGYVAYIGFWHPPYATGPGVEESIIPDRLVPRVYSLSQNYPNPVLDRTTISYGLPKQSFVDISIYSSSGQKIRRLVYEDQSPGFYRITWDLRDVSGHELPNGVYFYRMSAQDFMSVRKMVILR
jgi:hypothetical protein